MTNKKSFGAFIKLKRTEKNYSQKQLAELLFVTEGAVSKWERGVSYPDITLISDICRVLDISEHELITASTDSEARRQKREAKNFRIIKNAWIMAPTIAYIVALIPCFICNLAVNHTLSWFFVVLSALVCAYTFVPTLTYLFKSHKLLVFSVSTFLSICLLLFTCAVYTNGLWWFLRATIGTLIGYLTIFLPILWKNRYRFVVTALIDLSLTLLLLVNINPPMLNSALLITTYAYLPAVICTFICTLKFDAFLKSGICVLLCTILYAPIEFVVDLLFETNEKASYAVNFGDWANFYEGNIYCIVFVFLFTLSAIFFAIGFSRTHRNKGGKL